MAVAYVFRCIGVITQGILVLMGYALFKLAVTIRDDTRDLKRDMPAMQKDISELKEQGKTFATKTQLEAAEQRVKDEFAKELKKGKVISSELKR